METQQIIMVSIIVLVVAVMAYAAGTTHDRIPKGPHEL
jgi:hypothetical protein